MVAELTVPRQFRLADWEPEPPGPGEIRARGMARNCYYPGLYSFAGFTTFRVTDSRAFSVIFTLWPWLS